ncbi:MAG: TetR/AcrR family transcriptional regulator [Deltaproteobacteria bacterium]|nr:TetR/AcrR family transcriptional regulator [Deltaproteobacteria bacterium]
MARPRLDPDGPSTSERLLGAAEKAFARFGFVETRLEDIARRVGITRPSLLYHFETKERLYSEVVRRAAVRLRVVMEEAIDEGGTFEELLDRLFERYVHFLETHPDLARVLLREVLEGRASRTQLLSREIVPLLDWVSGVLEVRGEEIIPPDLPVRAAVLQVCTAALVQATSGSFREEVWGTSDHSGQLARILFLGP